eukprot:TRINITY_DN4150_c0_g1_i3.p15 TRINITY_DN4150_c0_g1~~TRINITY_DN4150_c0_g1_i3.p15  ORF type:complete len:103 (-),score=0.18 TRINITY_DN4150_c0_g1_i3:1907-2215(-)
MCALPTSRHQSIQSDSVFLRHQSNQVPVKIIWSKYFAYAGCSYTWKEWCSLFWQQLIIVFVTGRYPKQPKSALQNKRNVMFLQKFLKQQLLQNRSFQQGPYY